MSEVLSLAMVTALLLGSPGPAPLALAAIGATSGISKGLPFLAGILVGLLIACVASAVGLSFLVEIHPVTKFVVQLLGASYFVYVAYKIATIVPPSDQSSASQTAPGFVDGLTLNLLNPKAYAAFLAIFSQFSLTASTQFISLFYTGLISFLVAVAIDFLWFALGGVIRPLFREPKAARRLRLSMAGLVLLIVLLALIQQN